MARIGRLLATILVAPLALSCGDDSDTTDDSTLTTAVVVDPEQFLGTLGCGTAEGAPQSYLATVYSVAESGEEVVIGTSGRVSCATPLAFSNVVIDVEYRAHVDVFAAPPGETTGAPDWSTTCGEHGGAARARTLRQVVISGCDPISGGAGETGITVDATAAASAAGLTCASDEEPGDVEDIAIIPVEPEDTEIPEITQACGQDALSFDGDLVEPGTQYTFRLEASSAKSELAYASMCSVTAVEGLTVDAECSPLTDRGEIVFPLDALADGAGVTCGSDLTRARISLLAGPEVLKETIVPCGADPSIDAVRGSYVGAIELLGADSTLASFSCTTSLDPASIAVLSCVEED